MSCHSFQCGLCSILVVSLGHTKLLHGRVIIQEPVANGGVTLTSGMALGNINQFIQSFQHQILLLLGFILTNVPLHVFVAQTLVMFCISFLVNLTQNNCEARVITTDCLEHFILRSAEAVSFLGKRLGNKYK